MADAKLIKEFERPTQAETNYIPLSATKGKACANCRWLIDDDYCFLIANEPEMILPTGYCDRWEAKPEPVPDAVEVLTDAVTEAIGGLVETMDSGMQTMTEAMPAYAVTEMNMEHKPKSLLQRAKARLFPEKEMGAFGVYKGADGNWHWIAKYSNAYEDKEGEIFTEKAHEDYIRRLDMGLVDQPELWVWHTKGTKHGKADTVFGVGRIMIALGHFDDTPEAANAVKFYQKNAGKLKLSHGALAPKWAVHDGLIESYNTFEISVLPDGAESNPYTSYEVIKSMQPDPKKLQMVEAVLGKEKADKLVSDTAEYSKELDDMLVRYKDNAQVSPDAPAPITDAQKSIGEVFVEMVKEQGDMAKLLIQVDKKISAQDELIKSLTKEVTEAKAAEVELRKLLNAPLRRPSGDDSTEVSKETVETVQKQAPNSDSKRDQMRGFLGLPPNGSN